MKYFIASIHEQNGEYEYTTTIRFKAESYEEANRVHEMRAGTWYGEDNMKWSIGAFTGEDPNVSVAEGELTEIDEHTFNSLGEHGSLPDMTPNDFEDVEEFHRRIAEERAEFFKRHAERAKLAELA